MKRLFCIALFCLFVTSLHAQVAETTVCDILKDPQSFNGKIVRIKGTVSAGFDEFIIKGGDCHQAIDSIWLAYPEGTKAKSGPLAILQLQPASNFTATVVPVDRSPVALDKSKEFKQFDSALAAPYKNNGMCLGCPKFEVSATLTGRIDAANAGLRRDVAGKIEAISGFGNMNAWPARLVLQSVADVATHEVDYTLAAAIAKDEANQDSPGGDPVAAAHGIAKVFGAGNALGEQVERAAAAFGKPGENNGVIVGFGGGNEATAHIEQKSDRASPDGVLYNCTFDSGRLKGNALALAIAHMGQHVADLRESASATPYVMEERAWVTTTLGAIGARQRTLTIPGGYILWNASWPKEDLNQRSGEALTEFLAKQALLAQ